MPLGIQHTMRVAIFLSVACPAVWYFPILSHRWQDFPNKRFWAQNMCFDILYYFSEAFLILRRTEWDMIKMFFGLHVKYQLFLSDINETCIFSTDFRKIPKYQISWTFFLLEPSCSTQTDGQTSVQTDMTELLVVFRNFVKALKRAIWLHNLVTMIISLASCKLSSDPGIYIPCN